ncbi:hypothetical protein AFLA_004103 [Aspergillus flavus NRRL3357]|nr:hypothetical protein AFLA_004103 [Aspergillus flavus NRRL3357]
MFGRFLSVPVLMGSEAWNYPGWEEYSDLTEPKIVDYDLPTGRSRLSRTISLTSPFVHWRKENENSVWNKAKNALYRNLKVPKRTPQISVSKTHTMTKSCWAPKKLFSQNRQSPFLYSDLPVSYHAREWVSRVRRGSEFNLGEDLAQIHNKAIIWGQIVDCAWKYLTYGSGRDRGYDVMDQIK